jgi:hypothetical protein
LELTLTPTGWQTPLRKSAGRWKKCPRDHNQIFPLGLTPTATRTQRKTVTFDQPSLLKGMELLPGNYVVVTDE